MRRKKHDFYSLWILPVNLRNPTHYFDKKKKFSFVNLLNPQMDGEESNDSVLLVAEMAWANRSMQTEFKYQSIGISEGSIFDPY
jgi:alpha/beta superfamily hydrolase